MLSSSGASFLPSLAQLGKSLQSEKRLGCGSRLRKNHFEYSAAQTRFYNPRWKSVRWVRRNCDKMVVPRLAVLQRMIFFMLAVGTVNGMSSGTGVTVVFIASSCHEILSNLVNFYPVTRTRHQA